MVLTGTLGWCSEHTYWNNLKQPVCFSFFKLLIIFFPDDFKWQRSKNSRQAWERPITVANSGCQTVKQNRAPELVTDRRNVNHFNWSSPVLQECRGFNEVAGARAAPVPSIAGCLSPGDRGVWAVPARVTLVILCQRELLTEGAAALWRGRLRLCALGTAALSFCLFCLPGTGCDPIADGSWCHPVSLSSGALKTCKWERNARDSSFAWNPLCCA